MSNDQRSEMPTGSTEWWAEVYQLTEDSARKGNSDGWGSWGFLNTRGVSSKLARDIIAECVPGAWPPVGAAVWSPDGPCPHRLMDPTHDQNWCDCLWCTECGKWSRDSGMLLNCGHR